MNSENFNIISVYSLRGSNELSNEEANELERESGTGRPEMKMVMIDGF
jgi:hypothetical protein